MSFPNQHFSNPHFIQNQVPPPLLQHNASSPNSTILVHYGSMNSNTSSQQGLLSQIFTSPQRLHVSQMSQNLSPINLVPRFTINNRTISTIANQSTNSQFSQSPSSLFVNNGSTRYSENVSLGQLSPNFTSLSGQQYLTPLKSTNQNMVQLQNTSGQKVEGSYQRLESLIEAEKKQRKQEMEELKKELKEEIKAEIKSFKHEMQADMKEMKQDIGSLNASLIKLLSFFPNNAQQQPQQMQPNVQQQNQQEVQQQNQQEMQQQEQEQEHQQGQQQGQQQ